MWYSRVEWWYTDDSCSCSNSQQTKQPTNQPYIQTNKKTINNDLMIKNIVHPHFIIIFLLLLLLLNEIWFLLMKALSFHYHTITTISLRQCIMTKVKVKVSSGRIVIFRWHSKYIWLTNLSLLISHFLRLVRDAINIYFK